MTDNKPNNTINTEHTELEGLIPWYVNGTLSAEESAAVEQHMAVCKQCQSEALRCQSLVGQLPAAQEIWKPSAAHFADILANVDKLEAVTAKPDTRRTKARLGFFQRISVGLSQTPSPVRWTLAFETLAFAALALFLVLPNSPIPKTGRIFETLSNAELPTTKGKSIRLVFSEDMTTRELFDLLKQAKAQIRQGPSEVGSYTVEVASQDEASSLSVLRANPKVRLAQAVE
jgi:anti-sigma-K factor RskA